MSKLKVGDRVRFVTASPLDKQIIAAKVGEIAEVVEVKEYGEFQISIRFSDGKSEWMARRQLRRLVKRKRPKPAAPDRVMVAAAVFGGLLGEEQRETYLNGWSDGQLEKSIADAFKIADALIAEGAK